MAAEDDSAVHFVDMIVTLCNGDRAICTASRGVTAAP